VPPPLAVIVTTVEGRLMRCAEGKGVMKNDDVGDRRGRCVFFVFLAGSVRLSADVPILYVLLFRALPLKLQVMSTPKEWILDSKHSAEQI
jgi:hypothetical protein